MMICKSARILTRCSRGDLDMSAPQWVFVNVREMYALQAQSFGLKEAYGEGSSSSRAMERLATGVVIVRD